MSVQIITTPSGERLVVIPEIEYRELLASAEDAADAAAVSVFRDRLATGAEELVPAVVVDRVLDGESRVRAWREHRGLGLAALAEATSIDPDMLAAIEDGRHDPTVAELRRLAETLNLTLDDLTG